MNLIFTRNLQLNRLLPACLSPVSVTAVRTKMLRGRKFEPDPNVSAVAEGEIVEEPHVLHAVWRIRSLKKRPYWEKRIMKQLQLSDIKKCDVVIHKNSPQVNTLLSKVRHLVRIKPINPVYGYPDGDYEETLLKWNGNFIVKRKIDPKNSNCTKSLTDGVSESENRDSNVKDSINS